MKTNEMLEKVLEKLNRLEEKFDEAKEEIAQDIDGLYDKVDELLSPEFQEEDDTSYRITEELYNNPHEEKGCCGSCSCDSGEPTLKELITNKLKKRFT